MKIRAEKIEWSSHDVKWYVPGNKAPVAFSTMSTKYSIEAMADEYPSLTICQLQEKLPYDSDARKVLQQYIDLGFGNQIANEWFHY